MLKVDPGMHQTHLIFTASLLWVPGAYSLGRLYRLLLIAAPRFRARPLGRVIAFATLLGLPLVTVWPPLVDRFDEISGREAGSFAPGQREYVELGLPGASVQAGQEQARQLRSIVEYVWAHTNPGD